MSASARTTDVECSACGRLIKQNHLRHIFTSGRPGEGIHSLCVKCMSGDAKKLHTLVSPSCTVKWHDVWDHNYSALARNITEHRALVSHMMKKFGADVIIRTAAALMAWEYPQADTAADLIDLDLCSGACLVASHESLDSCDCRCRGEWHGVLAGAEVRSRWYDRRPRREGREARAVPAMTGAEHPRLRVTPGSVGGVVAVEGERS